MAVNVKGGQLNVAIAKQTIAIVATGVTALNINKIFLIGPVLKSYVPGRIINSFNQFETDKQYLINAKIDMDLSDYLQPPFTLEWTDTEW